MSATTYLVLDIETVPDDALWTPPEPAPGADRGFPPLYATRPVVLGVMWLDENLACKRMGTIGDDRDEAGMLADFTEFMTRFKPDLVTWNGRGFDLPVLVLRSLRHGVALPWYFEDPDYRERRTERGHLDLADFLAGHGASRMTGLDGAARLCGLPGKAGIDGSQVEGLYRAGQMEALRNYCLSDVAQTAFVFLRTRLLTGAIDREGYRAAAAGLLAAIESDGRLGSLVSAIDRPRLLLA
jgi:predicted PolB exonuclease-like 3'-5' exonuclease